jgi:hypothetical protein
VTYRKMLVGELNTTNPSNLTRTTKHRRDTAKVATWEGDATELHAVNVAAQ